MKSSRLEPLKQWSITLIQKDKQIMKNRQIFYDLVPLYGTHMIYELRICLPLVCYLFKS